jgi:hypothetical protein
MKFGELLKTLQVPGWERYYLDYDGLKVILGQCKATVAVLRDSPDGFAALPRAEVPPGPLPLQIGLDPDRPFAFLIREIACGEWQARVTADGVADDVNLSVFLSKASAEPSSPVAPSAAAVQTTSPPSSPKSIGVRMPSFSWRPAAFPSPPTSTVANNTVVTIKEVPIELLKAVENAVANKKTKRAVADAAEREMSVAALAQGLTRIGAIFRRDDEPKSPQLQSPLPDNGLDASLRVAVVTTNAPANAAPGSLLTASRATYVMQRNACARFAVAFRAELTKIADFYRRQSQFYATAAAAVVDTTKHWSQLAAKDRANLVVTARQVCQGLDNIQQFCDVNDQAMGKILKKYDKITCQNSRQAYADSLLQTRFHVGHPSRISQLKRDVHSAFMDFAGMDAKQADHLLHSPDARESGEMQIGHAANIGTCGGAISVLLVASASEWISLPRASSSDVVARADAHITTFGMMLSFIALPLLFSVNMSVWERFRINYVFMLELDPAFTWSARMLMAEVLPLLLIWAVGFYCFSRAVAQFAHGTADTWPFGVGIENPRLATEQPLSAAAGAPQQELVPFSLYPFLVLVVCVWYLAMRSIAWKRMGRTAVSLLLRTERNVRPTREQWLLPTLKRLFLTPKYAVRFPEFVVADELTSLASALYELQYNWCSSHTYAADLLLPTAVSAACGSVRHTGFTGLGLVPNVWRFMQCVNRYHEAPKESRKLFPHAINAGKYMTDIVRMLCGFLATWTASSAMHTIMVLMTLIATIYKCCWDFFVDYAVIRPFAWTVRKERIYGHLAIYLLASAINVTLRFSWVAQWYLLPKSYLSVWGFTTFSLLEVVRRFVWNFFRFENEQVNNIENYRSTRLCPLPRTNFGSSQIAGPSEDEIRRRFSQAAEMSADGIRLADLSQVTALFAQLPEAEKVRILRLADPDYAASSLAETGKRRHYAALPEEVKVHALLQHVGTLTFAQYSSQFADPASSPLPPTTSPLPEATEVAAVVEDLAVHAPTSPAE